MRGHPEQPGKTTSQKETNKIKTLSGTFLKVPPNIIVRKILKVFSNINTSRKKNMGNRLPQWVNKKKKISRIMVKNG